MKKHAMVGKEKEIGKVAKEKTLATSIKNPDLVQQRRLQIAIGASKLFVERGYFSTTMRDICKSTDMTIGNLYDYISKKEDILWLVFDVFHSLSTRKLKEAGVFEIEDPAEQLRAAIARMLETAAEYRDMVILIYRESKSLPKEFLKSIMEKESETVRHFEKTLKKGVEKGVFKVKDPFLTANIIVYLVSIEPLRGWNLKRRYKLDEVQDYIRDYIMESICKTSKE